jgi:hypothetical protein
MQIARSWVPGLVGLAVALVACAGSQPPSDRPGRQPRFVSCQAGSGRDTTKMFSPTQTDSLVFNGHKLVIPAGALSRETEFRMRELPTRQVKVRLWGGKSKSGNWREEFRFEPKAHATLAVSYRRCSNKDEIAKESLAVYRGTSRDVEDTTPVEPGPRPSRHYPQQFEVRASLSHLSGYVIGAF